MKLRGFKRVTFAAFACAGILLPNSGCNPSAAARSDHASPLLCELQVSEKFAFSPDRIVCERGQIIRLRITNRIPRHEGDLAHNFVLLALGTDVGAFAQATASADAQANYVPEDFRSHVLFSTKFVRPNEVEEVTFTAPVQSGSYPIVCSFPGHCLLGMKGELVVR
jgi:azurin